MKTLKSIVVLVLTAAAVTACGGSDSPSLSAADPDQIGNLRVATVTNNFNDGSSSEITTIHDSNNLLTQQILLRDDATTNTRTFTYNSARQITSRTDDEDSDGTIERSYNYFYSETGQMSRREQDIGNDGSVDFVRVYSFDSVDQATGYTVSRLNVDGSTTAVASATHSYILGALSTTEFDNDPLGDVDTLHEFQYNPDGSVSSVAITSQEAGRSGEATYTYESGACDRTWTNTSFSYFCVSTEQ